jgi:hypothetical protein
MRQTSIARNTAIDLSGCSVANLEDVLVLLKNSYLASKGGVKYRPCCRCYSTLDWQDTTASHVAPMDQRHTHHQKAAHCGVRSVGCPHMNSSAARPALQVPVQDYVGFLRLHGCPGDGRTPPTGSPCSSKQPRLAPRMRLAARLQAAVVVGFPPPAADAALSAARPPPALRPPHRCCAAVAPAPV